jgi:hypothetical protein
MGDILGSSSEKDIRLIDSSLAKITSLRGVHFKWISPERHGNDTALQTGLIAQEVETVFPDWVGEGSDGYKTLQPHGFEAIVAEAMKEIQVRIENLEKENQDLKSQIIELRKALEN